MIGKIILGILILMAAAVIVNPSLSMPAWNFAMSALSTLFWIVLIGAVIVGVIIVAIILWQP